MFKKIKRSISDLKKRSRSWFDLQISRSNPTLVDIDQESEASSTSSSSSAGKTTTSTVCWIQDGTAFFRLSEEYAEPDRPKESGDRRDSRVSRRKATTLSQSSSDHTPAHTKKWNTGRLKKKGCVYVTSNYSCVAKRIVCSCTSASRT